MVDVTYGSVCSGIEAASVAWEPLGWKPAWFSEIEPFPSAVLKHHWPEVDNLGDMLVIPDLIEFGLVDAPSVLVGGTPCQSFSLAGRRGGLADERGALTLAYVEILNRIDEVRQNNGEEECIAVWENVPGVLSSKDNAFGCFLAGLAGEDEPLQPSGKKWTNAGLVYGPQRAIAWRVLDAQYFGVAQRRRRVFVVASARDGFDPGAVLFESEGLQRSVEPWVEHEATEYSCTVKGSPYDMLGFGQYGIGRSASTCKARDYKDATDLVVTADGRVRKLTPVERERLQGFPDDHTNIFFKGNPASNTERYKATGNSMAVPVMAFIGSRIQLEVDFQL